MKEIEAKTLGPRVGAVLNLDDIFSVILPGISFLSEPKFASSPKFLCLKFPG